MPGAEAPEADAQVRSRLIEFLPRLRRFCHGLAGDIDLGDDLLQATFERALSRIELWQVGTSLESWVFRIARNLNIDRLRALKTRGVVVDIDEADDLPVEDELARLEFRSDLDAVRAALCAMPVGLREVITTVVLDGQTYKEAAELLDVPIGTVMSRVSRARQFIETYVNRNPEEGVAA